MESKPRISVIMSVYNSAPFLREAVDSILNQTFGDFEFLIVDDKSTDDSLEILKSYSDNRIQIFENQENIGLTKSLNKLLKIAKGEFIARMDADDISLPERFEKQVSFLEVNQSVVLCGTQIINSRDNSISSFPITHSHIATSLLFENPIAHPTVMFNLKANALSILYNEKFDVAQDYELWTNLIEKGNFENLNNAQLIYRNHSTNIGVIKHKRQLEISRIIKQQYLKKTIDNLPVSIQNIILTPEELSPIDIELALSELEILKSAVFKSNLISYRSFREHLLIITINKLGNIISKKGMYIIIKEFRFRILNKKVLRPFLSYLFNSRYQNS